MAETAQPPQMSPIERRADNLSRALQAGIFLALVGVILLLLGGYCTGPPGPIGPVGVEGPVGEKGSQGEAVDVVGPPGPKGDVGGDGGVGPRGETGAAGPIGEAGPQGEVGPIGETGAGERGEKGEGGSQGPAGGTGPPGPITYINAAPGIAGIIVPYTLLFAAEGIEVTDAGSAGTEVPRRLSRRVLDLSVAQAVRAQWAHNIDSQDVVKLRVEYWNSLGSRWVFLTPHIGESVSAFANQSTQWVSTPRFLPDIGAVRVRVMVAGDGALDPKITYVTLDTR